MLLSILVQKSDNQNLSEIYLQLQGAFKLSAMTVIILCELLKF